MLDLILGALWFFVPAGLANGAPVVAKKLNLNVFNYPIDGGQKYRDKRIFGDNKTYRGFFVGILTAIGTIYLQLWAYNSYQFIRDISFIDYSSEPLALLALLFAVGALGGDAIESFFKRQLGKKSGVSWMPFDQIDYIIGGLLAITLAVHLDFSEYLAVLIVWFIMHPVISHLFYRLKLRDDPF